MFNPIPFIESNSFYCWVMPALAIGTALASVVGGVINAFSTKKSNDKNLDFAKEQLAYEKELNENKYQMNVSDMQKAGLNPLNLTNASVSHSYHSANQQAIDTSGTVSALSNIASTYMSNKNQKSISDSSNATQKDINTANNDTAVKIAQINADVQKTKNEQEHELAVEQFRANKQREDALTSARIQDSIDDRFNNYISNRREFAKLMAEDQLFKAFKSATGSVNSFHSFKGWLKTYANTTFEEFKKMDMNNAYELYREFLSSNVSFTPYKSKYED